MSLRVVAASGPGSVRLEDRSAVIVRESRIVAKIPVEDLAVVVLDGPDLTITHQLLAACADHGVAVVFCDDKHMPCSVTLPIAGANLHSATLRAQIAAGVPAKKRAWQTIVRSKIRAQADLLAHESLADGPVRKLIPFVRSGDPDNVEARAARAYFDTLFGSEFIRDRDRPGENMMLNYGYAVVRAAVARAIVGAGLHPAIGVFHANQYNPFCLADDAMEPLRPLVDRLVRRICAVEPDAEELTPRLKRELVTVLGSFVRIGDLRFPLFVGLERHAASLRRAICEGEDLEPILPDFDGA